MEGHKKALGDKNQAVLRSTAMLDYSSGTDGVCVAGVRLKIGWRMETDCRLIL